MIKIVNWIFQRILRQNNSTWWPVHYTSQVNCPDNIKFDGADTYYSFLVSGNCYIQAINGIKLGFDVIFAPGVKIISANHDKNNLNKHIKCKSIIVGDFTWIGSGSIILPGVEIGKRCVVGAGSVVTKSFKENDCLIAGNPAKLIKKYKG